MKVVCDLCHNEMGQLDVTHGEDEGPNWYEFECDCKNRVGVLLEGYEEHVPQ